MNMTDSPRLTGKAYAVTFLITMVTGIFAQMFVGGRLIAFDDPAATAQNILANRPLFHLGFAAYLVEMTCNVAMTALFYVLLRPVSRPVALAATFIGLVGCAIKTISRLFFIAPLLVLQGGDYLKVFNREQLEALALLLLEVNDRGAAMALVFFGFYTVVKGWLMIRSTFFPRILGVLSSIAGFGWLTFLYPPLGYRLFSYVALVALAGSLALVVWLLVVGIDERRWLEVTSDGRGARSSG